MKTYQFKTNINCGGCIAAVTPFLTEDKGISKWSVDTTDKNKVLTVETAALKSEEVAGLVKAAGYKAEAI